MSKPKIAVGLPPSLVVVWNRTHAQHHSGYAQPASDASSSRASRHRRGFDGHGRVHLTLLVLAHKQHLRAARDENAMRMGYLDARALHPDVHACTLNGFAKEF